MPQITQEMVDKFKKVFKEEYGAEYSNDEAWEATHNLLSFFLHLIEMDKKYNKHEN